VAVARAATTHGRASAAATPLPTPPLPTPGAPQTHITIAGFQISPGGILAGYGVTANRHIDGGPESNGYLVFHNTDPVEHRLVECAPCEPVPTAAATPQLDVVVPPASTVEAHIYKDPTGPSIYIGYFDPQYPFMRGQLLVSAPHNH
jgi:hypothetical protein